MGLSSENWSMGSRCCWNGQDGEGEISLLPPTGQNSSARSQLTHKPGKCRVSSFDIQNRTGKV